MAYKHIRHCYITCYDKLGSFFQIALCASSSSPRVVGDLSRGAAGASSWKARFTSRPSFASERMGSRQDAKSAKNGKLPDDAVLGALRVPAREFLNVNGNPRGIITRDCRRGAGGESECDCQRQKCGWQRQECGQVRLAAAKVRSFRRAGFDSLIQFPIADCRIMEAKTCSLPICSLSYNVAGHP